MDLELFKKTIRGLWAGNYFEEISADVEREFAAYCSHLNRTDLATAFRAAALKASPYKVKPTEVAQVELTGGALDEKWRAVKDYFSNYKSEFVSGRNSKDEPVRVDLSIFKAKTWAQENNVYGAVKSVGFARLVDAFKCNSLITVKDVNLLRAEFIDALRARPQLSFPLPVDYKTLPGVDTSKIVDLVKVASGENRQRA